MIEITKLYILVSAWMTLTFSQGVWEIKNFSVHFLLNLGINFDEIQYVATSSC